MLSVAPDLTMHSNSPRRTLLGLHLAVFALLAMAVFGWGLHYKLSLYHPAERTSIQGPVAKLLSQEERAHPVKSPADQAADMGHTPVPALPWLALAGWSLTGLMLACLPALIWSNPEYSSSIFRSSVLRLRLQHWRAGCSLRPPPVFLPSR